jgi:2,3-bisphosphoglycerate-independent phosphoglycerate mutase
LSLNPNGGILADIAPTLLALMDLPQPEEMTGSNLAETPS